MEKDMVPMAPFWSKIAGVSIDANAFFLFVGCGKVASVLGMVTAPAHVQHPFLYQCLEFALPI